MKRKMIAIFFCFLFLFFIKIPNYVELNDLHFIETIDITCDDRIHVILKEIIPSKKDNGIYYEYKQYQEDGYSIEEIMASIEGNQAWYYRKAKIHISNCSNQYEILNYFSNQR